MIADLGIARHLAPSASICQFGREPDRRAHEGAKVWTR